MRIFLGVAALFAALLPHQVFAAQWQVDLIVFLDTEFYESNTTPRSNRAPQLNNAVNIQQSNGLSRGPFRLLSESDSTLAAVQNRLNNSKQFRIIKNISFIQNDPPRRNGPRVRITQGTPIVSGNAFDGAASETFPLDGSVELTLGRYLHLDLDLHYFDSRTGSRYRLREARTLRSEQLHHFDSPRFGVIAQVTAIK